MKNINEFKNKVIEDSKKLSFKETYDPREWQKLTKNTIRDYLVMVLNWKNSNPQTSTQLKMVDMLSEEQFKELSELTKCIDGYAMLGLTSAKYLIPCK